MKFVRFITLWAFSACFLLQNSPQRYNIWMLEQVKIQKQPYGQSPQSPTNSNRLQQYFESSSFLLQQEDLALFIKDLPMINLKEVRSINILISMLIKQNQLVGLKCQQQISLLKQEYAKHDKLLRTNKEIKAEKDKLEAHSRQLQDNLSKLREASKRDSGDKGQFQLRERKLQAQCIKSSALLKQANQNIYKLQQFLAMLCTEDYKKCQQLVKSTTNVPIRPQLHHNIQEYCQSQRRRYKCFAKVKIIVDQFCTRLDKIAKCVSPNVLASELGTQTAGMMELISEICDHDKGKKKKKKTQGSSEKNLSTSVQLYGSQRNNGFFEGMIQKLAETASNNNANKQTLAMELQEVRSSLYQTKNYYENVLKILKQNFSSKQDEIQKKLQLKEETIKFYEEEVQKIRQLNTKLKDQNEELNTNIVNLMRQMGQKQKTIEDHRSRIEEIVKDKNQDIQRVKNETEIRVEQLKKMAAMKIEQRQEIINQLNERRKKQQLGHESQLSQLRFKIKLAQDESEQKQKQLRMQTKNLGSLQNKCQQSENYCQQLALELEKYKKQLVDVEDKTSRRSREIDELKQTLSSLEHEKCLQSAYIGELQSKIQTLNNKIKSLESKAKNEASTKKQLTAMKNSIVEQKQKSQQYEAYCVQTKEQNQRLKCIVKQMKKQLEEVYVRLSELKQIEAERQRLFLESQNSERLHAVIKKDCEEMKFQIMRLEADNKKMHLEARHYRNIVTRISNLEQQ